MSALTLRIGVIGTGFGQRVLVPAFRLDRRCDVAVMCASRLGHAQEAARAVGVPQASGRWQEVVADPALDAIAIAVPPALQPPMALAALKHRKHLFCEKPLAMTAEDAAAILAAARQAGVAHMVDFEFLAVDAWERAKQLVETGTLGRLRHAVVSWQVETRASRAGEDSWKSRADAGGGTLNLFGSHVLAYLEWLLGPIERVAARLWDRREARAAEEHDTLAALQLELAGGLPATVTLSTHAMPGSTHHRVTLYGEQGTLVLENTSADHVRGFQLWLADRAQRSPQLVATARHDDSTADGRIQAVGRLVQRFVDWIQDGRPRQPSCVEGARVQGVLDAARQAHASRTWIECPARDVVTART